jgi:hypothetical protein
MLAKSVGFSHDLGKHKTGRISTAGGYLDADLDAGFLVVVLAGAFAGGFAVSTGFGVQNAGSAWIHSGGT